MKKHFFLLCYITLGLLPVQAHVPEMDSLLKRLDTVIKERPLAIEKKKSRLRELELRYSHSLSEEERFLHLGRLLEEYRSFNADSSLALTQKRLRLAQSLKCREYLDNARMNLAEVMGIAGMYKEALEQMDKVCLDSLP